MCRAGAEQEGSVGAEAWPSVGFLFGRGKHTGVAPSVAPGGAGQAVQSCCDY